MANIMTLLAVMSLFLSLLFFYCRHYRYCDVNIITVGIVVVVIAVISVVIVIRIIAVANNADHTDNQVTRRITMLIIRIMMTQQ